MISAVHINWDGDVDQPEVQVSGSSQAMTELGRLLSGNPQPCVLKLPSVANQYYPLSLAGLVVEVADSGSVRLQVSVDETAIRFRGPPAALKKLGQSLVNYFADGSYTGDHFHLDYFEGNDLLDPTNVHLIFTSDSRG